VFSLCRNKTAVNPTWGQKEASYCVRGLKRPCYLTLPTCPTLSTSPHQVAQANGLHPQ
jgi:hypothetical protein